MGIETKFIIATIHFYGFLILSIMSFKSNDNILGVILTIMYLLFAYTIIKLQSKLKEKEQ
jgi:hypothetical protein